ncbi:hypothetical protein DH2020_044542 [Rehmannia glutinosa]|uniref:non-specific serine/threonine protein kinase n=1 Tax=Rehmannia glutinosa TaxID=99300 RepID=A0ABR0UGM3_REHGL
MDNRGIILMQRYELGRLLGQGTFAKVYYARGVQTGQSVAIKVIDKEKITRVGIINQIKREISVMRLVRHPYIIHLYEVMATKTKIYFVMEYAKGGELFNKVAKGKLKEDVARKYFQHFDFGLSALAESKRSDGLLHTTCGTPAYVAPEVLERKGYDGAIADIWSSDDKQEALRLSNLNAFDIISLSDGFHLSRLFEESCTKKNLDSFRGNLQTPSSLSWKKLRRMKLKINKKDGGLFRFEGSKEGRKGKLCVDAEIFLLTPEIHLVEVKKTSGDTLEYEKILDEGIRPGLQDIVWSSQDESQPQQRYEQLEVQNGHPQPLLSQDQQIQHVNRQLEPLEQKPLLQDRVP